ncbi:MAG: acyl-CoA/acyl-ACP dehydrogenase [Chloroflexi bacterium]|nr:acyl-CoA/acyl-ACP dehydrogenase [Chloroflexota bacterium]
MDLALTETQQLVRDSIKEYLEREVPFSRVREVERGSGFDDKLWQGLQQLGWLGLPFPESHGGSGGSLTDLAVLVEALSRRAVLVPIAETMAAALTILRHGDAGTAADIVPRVVSGEVIVVPAVLEANDRLNDLRLEVRDGRLSGDKYFVDYARAATHHLVAANDGDGLGLFLVDARAPGVAYRPLRAIGRIPQAVVSYDGVPATRVSGADGVAYLVQLARALAAIQCLGSSQQALDMTVEYVAMRVQFGRPIGTFQAVQHHCADMATLVEATRFLAYEAVWAIDNDMASEKQVAVAKACASRTATQVPMQAHQLHGGIGFIEEYDLYFFSLRGKQHSLSWGSTEECLRVVAKTIEEADDWLSIRSAEKMSLNV